MAWQILGLIENMSCFKCPHCQEKTYIFGHGGARKTAEEMGMEFLGEVFSLFYYPMIFNVQSDSRLISSYDAPSSHPIFFRIFLNSIRNNPR